MKLITINQCFNTAHNLTKLVLIAHIDNSLYVTGFTKTIPISTRNEIQFIADY